LFYFRVSSIGHLKYVENERERGWCYSEVEKYVGGLYKAKDQ
jgi:hypothetical protein